MEQIKNKIFGYTTKGKPFTVSEYKETIQTRIDGVRNGSAKTYTSAEVSKRILKNRLRIEDGISKFRK